MNVNEFVCKYLGKKVDFDGMYGYQCVDLFRQYCKDVLNLPVKTESVKSAKDLFHGYENMPIEQKYFYRITNNYKIGDVIIWDNQKHGHVAIITKIVNDNEIEVIEQDGYKQDGVKIGRYNPKHSLGVLRFKDTF